MLQKEIFGPVVQGKIKPTVMHKFIGHLAKSGLLIRNFTQNIDGLEEAVGVAPETIVYAHGSVKTARCASKTCGKPIKDMENYWDQIMQENVPVCEECNHFARPDIVFFGEPLNKRFSELRNELRECDLLIVSGSTLSVYPFASLVSDVSLTTPRILINRELVGPFRVDPNDNPNAYRDVALVGDCDTIVAELAAQLGWKLN
jgi:NAD-dependent SIR2 family protein deacetylase